MISKVSIKFLIVTMLLGWLPQQMTICLASMAECVTCCCSCCPGEDGAAVVEQGEDSDTCCITLNVEPVDQTVSIKLDDGIKHVLVLVEQLASDDSKHQPGEFAHAANHAQAPPGPPIRLTLCSLLI
jgi:hypothetical protein